MAKDSRYGSLLFSLTGAAGFLIKITQAKARRTGGLKNDITRNKHCLAQHAFLLEQLKDRLGALFRGDIRKRLSAATVGLGSGRFETITRR